MASTKSISRSLLSVVLLVSMLAFSSSASAGPFGKFFGKIFNGSRRAVSSAQRALVRRDKMQRGQLKQTRHGKVDAALSLHALLVYEKPAMIKEGMKTLGMTLHTYIAENHSEAYVAVRPPAAGKKGQIVVAQAGTESGVDIWRDLKFWGKKQTVEGRKLPGRAYAGFLEGYQQIDRRLVSALKEAIADYTAKYGRENFYVDLTGHSLGAAQTTLFAQALENSRVPVKVDRVVPFASPRPGTKAWSGAYDQKLEGITRRHILDMDGVTHVPFMKRWQHVSRERALLHLESGEKLKGLSKQQLKKFFRENLWDNLLEAGTDHSMVNYVAAMHRDHKLKLPNAKWLKEVVGERMAEPQFKELFDQ